MQSSQFLQLSIDDFDAIRNSLVMEGLLLPIIPHRNVGSPLGVFGRLFE